MKNLLKSILILALTHVGLRSLANKINNDNLETHIKEQRTVGSNGGGIQSDKDGSKKKNV
jgi:hypothetical protein